MYKVGCVVPNKNGPNGWMTLRVIACPIRHPSRALPLRRRRRPRLPRDPCGTTTTTIIIRITTIILTIPFESCSNCLPNKKMSLTMACYRPPLNPSPFWYRNSCPFCCMEPQRRPNDWKSGYCISVAPIFGLPTSVIGFCGPGVSKCPVVAVVAPVAVVEDRKPF